MGKGAPIVLAFMLNCADVYIFRRPLRYMYFPYFSYFIFLLAAFCFLSNLPISAIPRRCRRLFPWVTFIIEFLFAKMVMETLVIDFWLPLQIYFINFLPKASDCITSILKAFHINCPVIVELIKILKCHETLVFAHYALSTFFLLCIAHATRIVDFRLLRCGGDVFIEDVKIRSKKFFAKLLKYKSCRTGCRATNAHLDLDEQSSIDWEPSEIFDSGIHHHKVHPHTHNTPNSSFKKVHFDFDSTEHSSSVTSCESEKSIVDHCCDISSSCITD